MQFVSRVIEPVEAEFLVLDGTPLAVFKFEDAAHAIDEEIFSLLFQPSDEAEREMGERLASSFKPKPAAAQAALPKHDRGAAARKAWETRRQKEAAAKPKRRAPLVSAPLAPAPAAPVSFAELVRQALAKGPRTLAKIHEYAEQQAFGVELKQISTAVYSLERHGKVEGDRSKPETVWSLVKE